MAEYRTKEPIGLWIVVIFIALAAWFSEPPAAEATHEVVQ